MRPRDIARAISQASAEAAEETRALDRGNVDSVAEDGRATITLSSGAKIKVRPNNLFAFSENESVTLLRRRGQFQAMAPSAFQGGTGAPFDPS